MATYYAITLGTADRIHCGLFHSLWAANEYAKSHYRHIDYGFSKIELSAIRKEAVEALLFGNCKAEDVRWLA